MHEMSLCQNLLDIIQDYAQREGFKRVNRVRLEVGVLSCVAPEALRFCFDAVTCGTVAEGAVLDIATPPGQAWCWDCERSIEIIQRGEPCPQCKGYRLQIESGDDLRIKELEVD